MSAGVPEAERAASGPGLTGSPGYSVAMYVFLGIAVVSVAFSVAVSSIAMGTAIVLWLVLLAASRGRAFQPTPFDWLFAAYLVAEALSTVFSAERENSFINMKRFFLISILYLMLTTVDTEQRLKNLLILLGVVAGLSSLVELFALTREGGHFDRLAIFQHVLTEGGIKMIVLLLLGPIVIHPRTPRGWRIFAAVCSTPLFLGLVLTQTRSAWLGFLAGVITIGIAKSRKIIYAVILLVVVFVLFAPADYRIRARSIVDPTVLSNETRIRMVETGWRMFLDRPLVGFGDVDLKKYYVTYITPLEPAEGGHLHNNIVMLLVTLGIPGFAATMALFVKIFLVERKAVAATAGNWLAGSVALGSLAAYIGFHVNGLFEWNFGDHEIAVLLWFTVGAALVSLRLSRPASPAS